MGGGRRARARVRERLARAQRAEGRQRRTARAQQPRVGARRLRARADRRGRASRSTPRARPRDVGYLLAHSEAVAVVCEDAEQLAKVEAVADELPSLQHVLTYHDLDRARGARKRLRGREPDRARRRDGGDRARTTSSRSSTRRGRPARRRAACSRTATTTRWPRVVDRMERDVLPPRRRHAPLPPARAQLRAADAAARGARRVHDRVPRRSAACGRGAPAGSPDAPAERPARLREGAHAVLARFDAATGASGG